MYKQKILWYNKITVTNKNLAKRADEKIMRTAKW